MDQRVKGGTPPTAASTLEATSAPGDSEQSRVGENNRRGEGENGNVGKKEEEKREAGRKKDGDKGAVLELLIEGRCGSVGQQQAKRTKKPPKILECYVCKPTIRTYQRQGRGGALKGDGEGGAGLQSRSSSTTDEANTGLDAVQTTSKKAASAASQPLTSSLSSSSSQPLSLSSAVTTESVQASAPAITSQGTKTAKQVG